MQRAAGCWRVGRGRLVLLLLAVLSPWLSAVTGHAVLFYSTGNPNYNTSAPVGSLTNSGWQFEGLWGSFLGTAIAPKFFITASHIGGQIGDNFTLNGVQYSTTAVYDDPDSDLRLWRICGSFPAYAQLYTNNNESNKSLVVIGRGTQRGGPVSTTNLLGTVKTNGWLWGPSDGVIRWGENVVAGIVDGNGLFGAGIGELIQATFDVAGGPNECHLSTGDSGGAVFIKDESTSIWKLAGINYAVEGPYNTTNSDPGFAAAIFDGMGLYEKDIAGLWEPTSGPGSFYATRISGHVSWINSIINGPGGDAPTLQSSPTVSGPYADATNTIVDDASNTITIGLPPGSRFYRLRACGTVTIKSIQVQNGSLVLTY